MFLSFDFMVWSSKLAMKVENLEKWRFIASWRLKEQKFEQENQFQNPRSFHFILFFLLSSLPSFGTKAKHLSSLRNQFKPYPSPSILSIFILKAIHILSLQKPTKLSKHIPLHLPLGPPSNSTVMLMKAEILN